MNLVTADIVSRFRRGRAFTRLLFDRLIPGDAWLDRPIALRNPFVFYEGHLSAFAVNTLVKGALSRPGIDARLELLFERGIDPEAPGEDGAPQWPTRECVAAYARAADAAIESALVAVARGDAPASPLLDRNEAVYAIFEHEHMHHETLLYMLREVPAGRKRPPDGFPRPEIGGAPPAHRFVSIPAGKATLGAGRNAIEFGWDNEFPETTRDVPAFSIDAFPVTNADFLEFVEAGGYRERSFWSEKDFEWVQGGVRHPHAWSLRDGRWFCRAQFEDVPLPLAWPVWVSRAEAAAYARFRGRGLPTEAEWHRAAFGRPDGGESEHPWGDGEADPARGNFGLLRFDPMPVDSFPSGASAFGVLDLVGNGWEWTASAFEPFPGFHAMASYPVYSTDFFDGEHAVLKGASPVTALPLVRRSWRNWFRTRYPYVFAKFRTVER